MQVNLEKAFCQTCLEAIKEDTEVTLQLVDNELLDLEFLKLDLEKELRLLYNPETQMKTLFDQKEDLLYVIENYKEDIPRLELRINELRDLMSDRAKIVEEERQRARNKIMQEVMDFKHEANIEINTKKRELEDWKNKTKELEQLYWEERKRLEKENETLRFENKQLKLAKPRKNLEEEIKILKKQRRDIKLATSKLAKELSANLYFAYFIGKNKIKDWRSSDEQCQLPYQKNTGKLCDKWAWHSICYDCGLRFCKKHLNHHDCPSKNKKAKELQDLIIQLKALSNIYEQKYYYE